MIKAAGFNLKFIKKAKLAENIYSFYFKKPTDFNFLAGQYLQLVLTHKDPDNRGTARYFTIASSPLEKEIMITTRLRDSTFKRKISSLNKGYKVEIFGPMGKFVLPVAEKHPLIFISGGMGITPFRSMINYAAAKKLNIPMKLFAWFADPNEAIFYRELDKITNKNNVIKIAYTFSYSQVFKDVAKEVTQGLEKNKYYIVGPAVFVAKIKESLEKLGVEEERILTEDFTGY